MPRGRNTRRIRITDTTTGFAVVWSDSWQPEVTEPFADPLALSVRVNLLREDAKGRVVTTDHTANRVWVPA